MPSCESMMPQNSRRALPPLGQRRGPHLKLNATARQRRGQVLCVCVCVCVCVCMCWVSGALSIDVVQADAYEETKNKNAVCPKLQDVSSICSV